MAKGKQARKRPNRPTLYSSAQRAHLHSRNGCPRSRVFASRRLWEAWRRIPYGRCAVTSRTPNRSARRARCGQISVSRAKISARSSNYRRSSTIYVCTRPVAFRRRPLGEPASSLLRTKLVCGEGAVHSISFAAVCSRYADRRANCKQITDGCLRSWRAEPQSCLTSRCN